MSFGTQEKTVPPRTANYVALLRSNPSDDGITNSLETELGGVAAGDFTDGWLVSRPGALDVLRSLRIGSTAEMRACSKSG